MRRMKGGPGSVASTPGAEDRSSNSIVAPGPTRLTDEQARLAAEHWDLALTIARVFAKRYEGYPIDFEGAAAMGICQAALTWDPEGEASFPTWLGLRVRFACIDALRAIRMLGYGRNRRYEGAPLVLSLDYAIESEYGAGLPLSPGANLPSGEDPTGWEAEAADEVLSLSRTLPKGHGAVVRLLYLDGATSTMREAGRRLGLSESRVSQMHKQALAWLRDTLLRRRTKEDS